MAVARRPRRVAVVFGAAVWSGGRASPALARRTRHAAALFHADRVDHVVVSGGWGRHAPAEATVMRDLLLEAGVPGAAITRDTAATTTMATAAFTARWRREHAPTARIVGVTDRFHARRARMALSAHGIAATMSWPRAGPTPSPRTRLREALSTAVYALRTGLRRPA